MLRVNIVGIGPGNPELLTNQARRAIEESNILIGDKRMLVAFGAGKHLFDTIKPSEIAEICQKADAEKDVVAVLVSGDVGFFSLAKTITGKLADCECRRYCGISSLVYFSQQLNIAWDDAKIVSMHGRNQNLIAAVAQNSKVFSLTGGEHSPNQLCLKLCDHGMADVKVYVGENLSYPEEKITYGTAAEISKLEFPSLSVMMILNEHANDFKYTVHGLNDDLFIRSKVPMTKQEVRAVSISKLMPKVTDNIYDIGAGTGSCSIELALRAQAGSVWAFERNPLALELLEKNKASEQIVDMPAPDCVFIGGSGGNLCKMLDTIYTKNSDCRVVINAITIETLIEVVEYYKTRSEYELEIVNVFAARGKKLGEYNLMMGQNPVYIMTALKKGE